MSAFFSRCIRMQYASHKVRTYKEYHSVCPSTELGLCQPLSRQRVFPSPQKQGGGGTLACGWGVGGESQFRRGAYTVVLFICTYFVMPAFFSIRYRWVCQPSLASIVESAFFKQFVSLFQMIISAFFTRWDHESLLSHSQWRSGYTVHKWGCYLLPYLKFWQQ